MAACGRLWTFQKGDNTAEAPAGARAFVTQALMNCQPYDGLFSALVQYFAFIFNVCPKNVLK